MMRMIHRQLHYGHLRPYWLMHLKCCIRICHLLQKKSLQPYSRKKNLLWFQSGLSLRMSGTLRQMNWQWIPLRMRYAESVHFVKIWMYQTARRHWFMWYRKKKMFVRYLKMPRYSLQHWDLHLMLLFRRIRQELRMMLFRPLFRMRLFICHLPIW